MKHPRTSRCSFWLAAVSLIGLAATSAFSINCNVYKRLIPTNHASWDAESSVFEMEGTQYAALPLDPSSARGSYNYDQGLGIIKLETGELRPVSVVSGISGRPIPFIYRGRPLLVVRDLDLTIYDPATGTQVRGLLPTQASSYLQSIRVFSDGVHTYIAGKDRTKSASRDALEIFRVGEGNRSIRRILVGSLGRRRGFSAAGLAIVTMDGEPYVAVMGDHQEELIVVNATSGKISRRTRMMEATSLAAFTERDRPKFLTGFDRGVQVLDAITGDTATISSTAVFTSGVEHFETLKGAHYAVGIGSNPGDGRFQGNKRLVVFDLESKKVIKEIPVGQVTSSLTTFHHGNGTFLAWGTESGQVVVANPLTGTIRGTVKVSRESVIDIAPYQTDKGVFALVAVRDRPPVIVQLAGRAQ